LPKHDADTRTSIEEAAMKIKLNSIFVENQDRALDFYTHVLGFIKKHDVPVGQFRWISLVSPEGNQETELLLEPNENPAARTFQEAIFKQGIPITAFEVDDLDAEYARLSAQSVVFTMVPTVAGPVKIAVFADTCGNLIQLYQPME
jgi:catechol 2,3-dioxygenase-like lactoylglutathione lyase family enzyme